VRRAFCVPMIFLCLLTAGCGSKEAADPARAARQPYQAMTGCSAQLGVTCGIGAEDQTTFELRGTYVPQGTCTVEILGPETVAGVSAVIRDDTMQLIYDGECLNAGTLSSQNISPAACLPVLMDALRDGWLLEENAEKWGDTPCLRLALDNTGKEGGSVISTLWLRREDYAPVHGEIAVDGEIILQAEFTRFAFGDILAP